MISYDENLCRMAGISPPAVLVANAILYYQLFGVEPTRQQLADYLGYDSTSPITTAINELRANGVMEQDSYDLTAYKEMIEAKETGITTAAMETANKIVRAFNNITGSEYKENDQNITALVARILKDGRSKDTIKYKDKDGNITKEFDVFESLVLRCEGVIAHQWEAETVDKKYVRPSTILRNPNRFYTNVANARNYWRVKGKEALNNALK